ncbi:hypothetical protein [Pedobacter sp. NJ-S-72]
MIGDFRTGGIGGESVKKANYADMKSQGIEVAIGGTVVKAGAFNWKTQIIFAHNTNKITNLKSQPLIFGLTGADGGALEGYAQRGLFSLDFKGLDPNNGSPSFINEYGVVGNDINLQSNQVQYLKYEGPVDPTYTGGFSNNFKYKEFTLSTLITFSAGNKSKIKPRFQNFLQ